jgi:hypothetical protein
MLEIVLTAAATVLIVGPVIYFKFPRIRIETVEKLIEIEKEAEIIYSDPRIQRKFTVIFHTDKGARARDAITNANPREDEAFEFFEGPARRQLKERECQNQ